MNEQLPNDLKTEDEKIAQRLSQVAEQIHANAPFATELEARLRNAHRPKMSWLGSAFRHVSPVLRWATLMIALTILLSWSIKTLVPAPQPATNNTPVVSETPSPTEEIVPVRTASPIPSIDGSYDWRGTKLYVNAPIPESPAEANVFLLKREEPVTVDQVRALAERFSMQGEIFESELEPNAPSAFSVVDGKQRLNVRSDWYFEYFSDYTNIASESQFSLSNPNAAASINEFLRSHDFDFPYTIERSELYGGFYVQALTPDGFPIHHEYFAQNGLFFQLNDTGGVYLSANLLKYDQVGTYGIKSVQEAFQQVVEARDLNGMIEGVHASGKPHQVWKRDYPLHERVILYGWLSAFQSTDGQHLSVSIDNFPAKGNLAGAEKLDKLTFVKATGQFTLENETKVFDVESLEIYRRDDHGYFGKDAFLGMLQKQGDDVVFVWEHGTFLLPDVPADVPLPLENAFIYGTALGDVFEWEGIEHAEKSEGGGGGGSNGMGFYKLNLSGTAVQAPTPTALTQTDPGAGNYVVQEGETCGDIAARFGISIQSLIDKNHLSENCIISVGQSLIIPGAAAQPADVMYVVQENDTLAYIASKFGITIEELKQANDIVDESVYLGQTLFIPGQQTDNPFVGMQLEKQRGILEINIYNQADGSAREEFVFIIKREDGLLYTLLENVSFEALLPYHHRPFEIWGTVNRVDQNGTPVIQVEKYEAPYPGLTFQLAQGTQKSIEINGAPVNIFTTEAGAEYVQMTRDGLLDMSIAGDIGDQVYAEALFIPDETFEGYPVMRVFNLGLAVNPDTGQSLGIELTADQPNVIDEAFVPESFDRPAATIEMVELVYYIPDSRYVTFSEGSNAEYIQPAWRFYGHYDNGHEFEILIQALKQEYLLPELAPFTRPG
jgi:LysM repeat protein